MKSSELYYRNPRQDSVSKRAGNGSGQSAPSRDQVDERIVALYQNGCSIESITREVGRARYRVVYVLQTRGLLTATPPRPQPERRSEPEPAREIPAPQETAPAMEPSAQEPVKTRRVVKRKAAGPSREAQKPEPRVQEPEGRWSPPLVDALCNVITRLDLYPGMSPEQIRSMVGTWNRQESQQPRKEGCQS